MTQKLPSTPDPRDRERAEKIADKHCPEPLYPVLVDDIEDAQASARREGDAEAAVLREALQNLLSRFGKEACTCPACLHVVILDAQRALSSTTAGADLLKCLSDAEQYKKQIDNLSLFVRRFCYRLGKHEPEATVIEQAHRYLKSIGQAGSPLRVEESDSQ